MSNLSLDGMSGGNLNIHRRRTSFPAPKVERELATMREPFFTPGNTGRALYRLLSYVRANKNRTVRQATLQATLTAIETWLNEQPAEDASLTEQLAFWRGIGHIADHAFNWTGRYIDNPRGIDHSFVWDTRRFAETAMAHADSEARRISALIEAANDDDEPEQGAGPQQLQLF